VCGIPILWCSEQANIVALSTAEAEDIALRELAKEIIFVVQIHNSHGIPVKTPITVHVDNMGAIFMVENATSNQRTPHIDVKHRFLVDLTEEGFLDVVFANLANNTSDGSFKNVSKEVWQCQTPKFMAGKSITFGLNSHFKSWGLLEMFFMTVKLSIGSDLNIWFEML